MASVTLKGNPVVLKGKEVAVGSKAPDFKLQGQDLSDVTLATSAGKARIICSVPSLDTSVCSLESKKFNEKAAELSGVEVIIVSTDLPFAMKRWCGAEDAKNIIVASDHRDASFGEAYGVLIGEGPLTRCLARAVFVVDADGTVKHVEYVPEIATEPNYEAALSAAKS